MEGAAMHLRRWWALASGGLLLAALLGLFAAGSALRYRRWRRVRHTRRTTRTQLQEAEATAVMAQRVIDDPRTEHVRRVAARALRDQALADAAAARRALARSWSL